MWREKSDCIEQLVGLGFNSKNNSTIKQGDFEFQLSRKEKRISGDIIVKDDYIIRVHEKAKRKELERVYITLLGGFFETKKSKAGTKV